MRSAKALGRSAKTIRYSWRLVGDSLHVSIRMFRFSVTRREHSLTSYCTSCEPVTAISTAKMLIS